MANPAYAVTNIISGLAASAFTPTNGPSDSTRAYLNDGRMDKPYYWSSSTNPKMDVNYGGTIPEVFAIALLNHNLPSGSTVVVKSADDAAFTTTVHTTTKTLSFDTLACARDSLIVVDTPSDQQYWRVDITTAGAQVSHVGELFFVGTGAGYKTNLSRNSTYGSGEREDLITVQSQMMYGETRAVFYAGPVREKRLRYADLSASALAEMRALWAATKGPVTPFLWMENYATSQDCIFGRLLRESHEWTQDDYGVYQPGDFIIRSLGREVGA